MKQCRDCGASKPLIMFTKHAGCSQGVRPECKDCQAKARKVAYLDNREQILVDTAQWAKANPDKRSAISKRYYQKNIDKEQKRSNYYAKTNPDVKRAQCAHRRATLAKASPPWLTDLHKDQIQMFYEAATALTKETGVTFEVDHIVPIKGKNARGLHVPWNLQVLELRANRNKSNKMPEQGVLSAKGA